MKKITLLLTAAIFSTTLCMAQQKPERKQMSIEQRTEKMVSALQLDDKQAKELKELNEKYADVLQRPERPHGKGHFGGPRGQRPPQMKQDGDNNTQERPQMKESHQGKPDRPQMSEEEREKMREKMTEYRKQREEYQKELQGILTETQYKKYQKMQSHHGGGKGHHKGMHQKKNNNE